MTARAIAASIAALGLAATAVQATEPTRTEAVPEAAPTTAEGQALRAVRDKKTGKLRAPTADELKALQALERAERRARGEPESKPLVIKRHPSGMLSAELGPEYMMNLRGERQPDGSVRRFHSDGSTHDGAPVANDDRPTE